jgi:polyferredoxin
MIFDALQNLFFPHEGLPILMIFSIVILFLIGAAAAILIRKKRLSRQLKILLLSVAFIFGGILLGGFPNLVLVIQNIFANLTQPSVWGLLLLRLSIFLGLTFFFGRFFCGFVCPLGAAQELASISRFKTKVNPERMYQERTSLIRWGFFLVYVAVSIIWGLEATLFMNPINGFLFLWTPFNILIAIAAIIAIATVLASFFVYRPYCRFFCPFGALAALLGRFSPLKLRRTEDCTECGICEKICPTQEAYAESEKGECYYCNRCMEACRQDAIEYSTK